MDVETDVATTAKRYPLRPLSGARCAHHSRNLQTLFSRRLTVESATSRKISSIAKNLLTVPAPLGVGAFVTVLLAIGALPKIPEAIETPGTDTGMYTTYGQMLLHGARPYVDYWDIHPPLVFAYWALVDALTGPEWLRTCFTITGLAPQSCTGTVAHGFDLLLSVATAVVATWVARRAGAPAALQAMTGLLVIAFAIR